MPTTYDLGPEPTELCSRSSELRALPRSMLAIADGCRARARHAKDCAAAKGKGCPMPKLRFRRADTERSIFAENLWILHVGTDHAQRSSKPDHSS